MKVPFIPYPGRVEGTVNGRPAVLFENKFAPLPASYELIRTETDIIAAIDLATGKRLELEFENRGFGHRVEIFQDLPGYRPQGPISANRVDPKAGFQA